MTHVFLKYAGTAGALALALAGCSAVTSTTNTAADIAQTAGHGLAVSSQQSTDASVTEPDTPRYARAVAFVDAQPMLLRREAARGGGERIDTLAQLLDTPEPETLGPWLQTHYTEVFGNAGSADAVVRRIAARRG